MTLFRTAFKTVAAAVILGFAGVALAQSPSGGDSGTSAGQGARDGSRPSDGAITGGSILPGETGGVPGIGGGSKTPSDLGNKRCNELSGSLRDQCLLQEQGASTGGTNSPDTGNSRPATPRMETPPQNPR
jgi:hypothetical protein